MNRKHFHNFLPTFNVFLSGFQNNFVFHDKADIRFWEIFSRQSLLFFYKTSCPWRCTVFCLSTDHWKTQLPARQILQWTVIDFFPFPLCFLLALLPIMRTHLVRSEQKWKLPCSYFFPWRARDQSIFPENNSIFRVPHFRGGERSEGKKQWWRE